MNANVTVTLGGTDYVVQIGGVSAQAAQNAAAALAGLTALTANGNVVLGTGALDVFGGTEAVGVGFGAGGSLTTGVRFTGVGSGAGGAIATCDGVTAIGWGAGSDAGQSLAHDNMTMIGANAYCTWENQVALGDDQVTELRLFGKVWARQFALGVTIVGEDAGNRSSVAGSGARVIVGYQAALAGDSALDERQVVIGYVAASNAEQNRAFVAIGDKAAQYAFNTIDCTLVGSEAGRMLGLLEPALYDTPSDEAHILAAGADVTHGGALPVPGLVGATFVGKNAGRYNTIGLNNTGFGDSALGYTTVGQANVAIGYVCGEGNVTGSFNVFGGQGVRVYCYSGDHNVLLGYGAQAGIGAFGGGVVAGGSRNSVVGSENTYKWAGSDVSGVGYRLFYNMTGGVGGDVGIGVFAGQSVITGGENVFVGANAGNHASQATDVQNSIAIGAGAFTTADNQVVLGNDSIAETILRGVQRGTAFTVAALPSAATMGAGSRAFVTDASATTFNSVVAGGGGNAVPVFSDGTNWRIG